MSGKWKYSRGKVMFVLDGPVERYVDGDYSLSGKLFFPSTDGTTEDAAFVMKNDPFDSTIPDLVKQGFIVRTRADELTNGT